MRCAQEPVPPQPLYFVANYKIYCLLIQSTSITTRFYRPSNMKRFIYFCFYLLWVFKTQGSVAQTATPTNTPVSCCQGLPVAFPGLVFPQSVGVNATGTTVYVVDTHPPVLKVFSPNGFPLTVVASWSAGQTFEYPDDVALD